MSAELHEILNSHHTRNAVVMGILNVTPDSFSDGGQFLSPDAAVAHARRMAEEGADIIDVGAESTRPGSDRVSEAEQIERLRDVVAAAASVGVLVSIDTTRSEVAAFALDAGAAIINDVSAGRDDPEMLCLAAERNAPIVLMHMPGRPKTMQERPCYGNVVEEVRDFLAERIAAATAAGAPRRHCMVDPGIGFGKLLEHNLALLAGVPALRALGCPVLIGSSRKRFIGELTGLAAPADRVSGTVAACLATFRRGATIFRVHDVGALVSALKVAEAIERAGPAADSPPGRQNPCG